MSDFNLSSATKVPSGRIHFSRVFKGLLYSLISSAILLLTGAAILAYTALSLSFIPAMVVILVILSGFIGGMKASSGVNEMGLVHGGLVGLFYVICVYIISLISFMGFKLDLGSLTMLICAIASSAFGGITGINTKKRKRKK